MAASRHQRSGTPYVVNCRMLLKHVGQRMGIVEGEKCVH